MELYITKFLTDENEIELINSATYHVAKTDLDNLYNNEFVRMTGSGSAIIAYFKSAKTCKDAQKKVKKKFRNYWSTTSKTI